MFNIKLFGKEILSFGKKTFQNINAALRWLEQQWDGTDAKVTKANAYPKHVWVYSCVNAIARTLAQVPFRLYNIGSDKEVTSGPAFELFRNPSPILSRFQLWEGEEIYKNIRGEAFWHLIRGTSFPVEIEFLEPGNMEPVIVDGIIQMWKYHRQSDGVTIHLDPVDVVHFKYYNPNDPYRGLSPLQAAMLGIEIDDDARRFDRNVLRNGTYPGSVIEIPESMQDDSYKRFQQSIKVENRGIKKAGRIMILEGGAKWREIKITAQELQFMERKKMAMKETGAIYRVPPIELGDFENSGKSDSLVQIKMFWTRNLIPEMTYIQDVLNTNFFPVNFPGTEGRFDTSQIKELQQDLLVAAETATAFYKMGIPFSIINERMNLGFDLTKMIARDTVLVPFSVAPIEDVVSGATRTPPEEEPDKMLNAMKAINKMKIKGDNVVDEAKEKKHFIHWKRFIQKLNPIISQFQGKIKKFMFEARMRVLANYTELAKSVDFLTPARKLYKEFIMDHGQKIYDDFKKAEKSETGLAFFGKAIDDYNKFIAALKIEADQIFNNAEELKKLKDISRPFIMAAIKEGGQDVFTELSIEGTFEVVDQRAIDFFNNQLIKLKDVTDTLSEEIRLTLQEGVTQGLTNADIVEALKHDFNVAGNRARTIARTETVSAANGGRVQGYLENGVEKHEWVNSFDEKVREAPNHRITEIINVGEEFSNGLKWPGDKDGSGSTADNIINCRCTTIAVIE